MLGKSPFWFCELLFFLSLYFPLYVTLNQSLLIYINGHYCLLKWGFILGYLFSLIEVLRFLLECVPLLWVVVPVYAAPSSCCPSPLTSHPAAAFVQA